MRLETLVALGTLSPRQREALVDRVVLGRSLEVVADDMGCTVRNVSELTRTARESMALSLRRDDACF